MRVTSRISDERGATAVMFALLLVVFIAVLALATDGGLLFVKYRQVRRANDAAALAAAINCVKFQSQGTAGANTAAGDYAAKNVTNPTLWADNEYPNGCVSTAGKVIVHYGASQSLSFGPAIGISSPKQVTASSAATWGAAGSVGSILPLAVAQGTDLSNCTVAPDGTQPAIGSPCKLWWDNSDGSNGKWGVISVCGPLVGTPVGCGQNGQPSNAWFDASYSCASSSSTNDPCACPGNSSANQVEAWMNGVSGSWFAASPPPPTYVCSGNGSQGQQLTNAINDNAACYGLAHPTSCPQDIVYLPVYDPTQDVVSCNQQGTSCNVYKYAVIGFAGLRIDSAYYSNGNNPGGLSAYTACNKTNTSNGNGGDVRCLIATWQGFSTGGLTIGNGNNFGPVTVALTG